MENIEFTDWEVFYLRRLVSKEYGKVKGRGPDKEREHGLSEYAAHLAHIRLLAEKLGIEIVEG